MAILLRFEKTHEDERQVEYIFGSREMDRRLVFEKDSLEGNPVMGTADGDFAAVMVKILRYRWDRGSWPASGAYSA
jgi:hypothetical protein